MPTKNPGLHLFTKTWHTNNKLKEVEENKRPLTATLDKPTVLDIRLIRKIDMSKIRKEFLNISNLCRIPMLLHNCKPHRPRSLPPPIMNKKNKNKSDIDDTSVEEESIKSDRIAGRRASKLKSITVQRTVKNCDKNNNNKSIRVPRKNKDNTHSNEKKRIGSPSDAKSTKLPQPCNSCGRSDQPERLHSHPIASIKLVSSPKQQVKSTVQKPVAIKYKSKGKEKPERKQSPKHEHSLPSQNIVHSNPTSANMLASRRLEIVKKNRENNERRIGSGKRTLTCYICGREYGTASLKLHEPKCLEKLERENDNLPVHLRRKPPVKPTAATTTEEWNELAWEAAQSNLVPCLNCGRTFYPDRLIVHQRSCKAPSVKDGKLTNQNHLITPITAPSNRPSTAVQCEQTSACYICGKNMSVEVLKAHEKQCFERWVEGNYAPKKNKNPQSPIDKKASFPDENTSLKSNSSSPVHGRPVSSKKPPLFPCYICNRLFSANSICFHEPQCLKKWKIENEKLPQNKRKQPPSKQEKYILDGNIEKGFKETSEIPWQDHLSQLIPCKFCGRTFNPDRVGIHENSCKGK
ncbi:zinc finger protein 474-like [Diorhabda sublineata]|uniref:zinc finger protein 474-like n=1 Tax=Diorhabda sublineata TaxID=1163346 RepID=UPI0024E0BA78|nr:zinc finger protein 474-like [Diorhabda sublineata]XP_056636333.1 zinc finger protein 474-like [Diorhabda sublineata]XP_056636334.1 zinc finger protein 474-like [Diorhabda sublineata]XP_056636335.1 zinc finger protein 474-like [Diorhabda sublineata]